MAFSLSALTAYVEENKADLIMKPITGSKIFDLIDVRQGIKSGMKIPILESTAPAQSGAACGFTSSGTTTVSQTTLNTSYIKVQEALCLQDLEAYFTQKYLPSGSKEETTFLEADIINRKLANIASKVGQMIMQGGTTYTNDSYLKQLNGFISQVDTAGNAVAATQTAGLTTANIRTVVEEIIFQKLPLAISETGDEVVFLGVDNYRILLQKLMQDGAFFYQPSATNFTSNEITYPGTNVRVIGLNEMNSGNPVDTGSLPTQVKNRILAGSLKNFVAGFDVRADLSDFDVWYSKDNQQLRFNCRFNIGCVNHFVDQLVQYKNL